MLFWSQEALSALLFVFSGMYRLNYADQTYVPEDLLSWLVNVYQMKIFWETFDSFQEFKIINLFNLNFLNWILTLIEIFFYIYYLIFKNIDWIWDFRIPFNQEFERYITNQKIFVFLNELFQDFRHKNGDKVLGLVYNMSISRLSKNRPTAARPEFQTQGKTMSASSTAAKYRCVENQKRMSEKIKLQCSFISSVLKGWVYFAANSQVYWLFLIWNSCAQTA